MTAHSSFDDVSPSSANDDQIECVIDREDERTAAAEAEQRRIAHDGVAIAANAALGDLNVDSHDNQSHNVRGSVDVMANTAEPNEKQRNGSRPASAASTRYASRPQSASSARQSVERQRIDLGAVLAIGDRDLGTDAAEEEENNKQRLVESLSRDAKFNEMKVSSMYNMVQPVKDLQGHSAKLVFLTNSQAKICCQSTENLHRFIEALDMPRPQLVINLEYSLGLTHLQELQQKPNYPGWGSFQMRETHDRKKSPLSLPWGNVQEAIEARAKLVNFMVEVLIPLAEQTNALIIISGSTQCELSGALVRAMALTRAKWGVKIPFTIMAIEHKMEELYNLPERERDASLWAFLKSQSEEWQHRDQKILDMIAAQKFKPQTAYDLNANASIFVVLDGIEEHEKTEAKFSGAPRMMLLNQIVSYFTQKIPCLVLRSGIVNSGKHGQSGLNGWGSTVDALASGIPVVLLDTRERQPFREDGNPNAASKRSKTISAGQLAIEEEAFLLKATVERAQFALEQQRTLTNSLQMPDVVDAPQLGFFHEAINGLYDGLSQDNDTWTPVALHQQIRCTQGLGVKAPKTKGKHAGKGRHEKNPVKKPSRWSKVRSTIFLGKVMPISAPPPDRLDQYLSSDASKEITLPKLTDVTLRALADHRFESFWEKLPQILKDQYQKESESEGLAYYGEYYDHWLSQVSVMFRSKDLHSLNVRNTEPAKKFLKKLVTENQLPKHNDIEGLLTLRSIWDHIDICQHHAVFYKVIGKLAFAVQLVLQVLIVLATTLNHTVLAKHAETSSFRRLQKWLEPECLAQFQEAMWHSDLVVEPRGAQVLPASRGLLSVDFDIDEWVDQISIPDVLFTLSLINALVLAMVAVWNPVSRWRQLRLAALSLESVTWKYRARVGDFQVSVHQAGGPESKLSAFLQTWLDEVVAGLDLQGTAFKKQYGDDVYKHLQYQGKLPNRKSREDDEPAIIDDYHTPVKPQRYIQLRVIRAQKFYSKRIPLYISRRRFWILLGLFISAASGACTYWGVHDYVALIGSVATAGAAWMEFTDLSRKIERYNTTVKNLDKLLIWWNSLRDVEQASKEMGTQLVFQAESIITGEFQAWQSTPAQENAPGDESRQGKSEKIGDKSGQTSKGETSGNLPGSGQAMA